MVLVWVCKPNINIWVDFIVKENQASYAFEIVCIGSGSTVAGTSGITSFGRYSILQDLVWVKWGIGTYLLCENCKNRIEMLRMQMGEYLPKCVLDLLKFIET